MWEAIEKNRRRSRLFAGFMAGILVGLGALIGAAVDPILGSAAGGMAALGVWLVLLLVAFQQGDRLLFELAGARRVEKEDSPRLWNVVEEMCVAAGLGTMPAVYILDDDAPNAFAAGIDPSKARLAVTTGLVKRLNRDELQGVVAHEIAHIHNLDIRFMTIVAVMGGAIVLVADALFRMLRYGGLPRRSSRGRIGGPFLVFALLASVLAPVCARLLALACSRRREYLADASAARLTRYPLGLASALEKISAQASSMRMMNRAIAPMMIVNPAEAGALLDWFSTHPPAQERIRILRGMGGMAGFADYEAAYRRVHGRGAACLEPAALTSEAPVAAREATPEAVASAESVERSREIAGVLGRLAGLLALPCACGLTIRIPPEPASDRVACPRCGSVLLVPLAVTLAGEPGGGSKGLGSGRTRYQRALQGWESFQCPCGKAIQLSPAFRSRRIRCKACGRQIEVLPPAGGESPSSSLPERRPDTSR